MSDTFTYSELETIIREKIDKGAEVTIQPRGTSMLPLIRQGVDEVILKRPEGRLKKYDIPFYKRKNGQFVLHRIVKVRKDDYVLCGDNQTVYEYGITDDMIIAVVCGIKRDGKVIKPDNPEYLQYCKGHVRKQKIKGKFIWIRSVLSRIKRKIIQK